MASILLKLVRKARAVKKVIWVRDRTEDADIAAAEARGWVGENTVFIRTFGLSAEEVAARNAG